MVDYVIETADNAASILAALDAAAADPSLVDTAIAAVDTASVFAGATTESITTAVAESAAVRHQVRRERRRDGDAHPKPS